MVRYEEIFTLEFLHTYYKDDLWLDLEIVPTDNTANLMRQYGCVLKKQINKWYLFTSDLQVLNETLNNNENIQLEFLMNSVDYNFIKFTDYPIDQLGYYFFSTKNTGSVGQNKIKLNPVFKTSQDVVNEVGRIKISLFDLLEGEKLNKSNFEIELHAREVVWKYLIINNSENNYNPLKLSGRDGALFSGPLEDELPVVGKAQVFNSRNNKFPIKEYGEAEISLHGKMSDGSDLSLIDKMPNAGPDSVQLSNENEEELNAVMYIYI